MKDTVKSPRIHEMRLDAAPFGMMKRGEKTIELRLFDEKRAAIEVGDRIRFTCTAGGETLTVRVTALYRFASFDELYKALSLDKCGYAPDELASASPRDMDAYYPREAQEKFGVVGIGVEIDG